MIRFGEAAFIFRQREGQFLSAYISSMPCPIKAYGSLDSPLRVVLLHGFCLSEYSLLYIYGLFTSVAMYRRIYTPKE